MLLLIWGGGAISELCWQTGQLLVRGETILTDHCTVCIPFLPFSFSFYPFSPCSVSISSLDLSSNSRSFQSKTEEWTSILLPYLRFSLHIMGLKTISCESGIVREKINCFRYPKILNFDLLPLCSLLSMFILASWRCSAQLLVPLASWAITSIYRNEKSNNFANAPSMYLGSFMLVSWRKSVINLAHFFSLIAVNDLYLSIARNSLACAPEQYSNKNDDEEWRKMYRLLFARSLTHWIPELISLLCTTPPHSDSVNWWTIGLSTFAQCEIKEPSSN